MNPGKLSERELLLLIEGDCDELLSQAEYDRLAQALRDDPRAQEIYQKYIVLDADLYWRHEDAADSVPWNKNAPDRSDRHSQAASLLGSDAGLDPLLPPLSPDLSGLSEAEPLAFELPEAEELPSIDRPRTTLKPHAVPPPGLFDAGWMEVVPWRLVGTCVFCLALVVAMSLDLRPRALHEVAVQTPPSTQPPERYALPSTVATLMSTIDCRWQKRSVPLEEGASIYPEQLDLLSGTAEILFGNGARVVLEGPASLMVQDAGRAVLEHGKLAVQVPKRAIGFTIMTPTVEVVDFGTEFGVAVTPEGIVDVAVLVGKVEVGSLLEPFDSHPRAEHEKRVVTAGQAVTAYCASNQLRIDEANFSAVMATSLAKPFESMARMPGKVVAYRAADRTAGNRRDFHGGVGLDFDVQVPIRIFSLGVFDHLGDGIDPSTSPTVQLWSRDVRDTPNDASDDLGREMLAAQVFTAEDSSELKLGHRFKPLAKPIELPVGSYSIVAYDLADGNPFVSTLTKRANPTGLPNAGSEGIAGQAGGTFARNDDESYYSDTKLNQVFTLSTPISASGTFSFSDAETMSGKFFIGHHSASVDKDHHEFIGMELVREYAEGIMGIRARIFRFNGNAVSDAMSGAPHLANVSGPYHFEYTYDPNYEADANHAGPEGRLILHVYNDADTFNSTLYAINDASHRDAGSTFDSFGMGISTMESESGNPLLRAFGDDPNATAKFFIDDVTYSGHTGLVDFNTDPKWDGVGNTTDGNDYVWAQRAGDVPSSAAARGGVETWHNSIVPIGSRLGLNRPGSFPVIQRKEGNDYGAGSFEYVSQQRQDTR